MDWEIKETDLKYLKKLGSGTSGDVHQVIWTKKDGTQCEAAAKKFKTSKKKEVKSQTKELNLLRKLKHPNIVEFFCAVLSPVTIIVTEYARYGSLFDYLKEQTSLPLYQVYDWALQATNAIQHIHDRGILHRDIKSGNFVICKDNVLKLCDFGISKNVVKTVCTDFELGTIPWMAPEAFVELTLTKATDVYSLSVVIWELVSCKIPYASRGFANIIWSVQIHKLRPDIPESCPIALQHLLEQCWNEEPNRRPKAAEIATTLKNMQNGFQDSLPSLPQVPVSSTPIKSQGIVENKMATGKLPSKSVEEVATQNGRSQDEELMCDNGFVTVPLGFKPVRGLPSHFCTKPLKDFVINIPDPSMSPKAVMAMSNGAMHIVVNPDHIVHKKGRSQRMQTVLRSLQILSCMLVVALVVCLLLHCSNGMVGDWT